MIYEMRLKHPYVPILDGHLLQSGQELERRIAWFAGLYEGEGSCSVRTSKRGVASVCLSISQNDPHILFAAFEFFGGSLYGPYKPKGPSKPIYYWRVYNWVQVERIVDLIMPWLSPRRQGQIRKVFTLKPDNPRGPNAISPCTKGVVASNAGYLRHWKRGEYPCEICRESERAYKKLKRSRLNDN